MLTSSDALALSGNVGIAIYALLGLQCFANPGRWASYGRVFGACAIAYAIYATAFRTLGLYGALSPVDASLVNGFASYVFTLILSQYAIVWRPKEGG